jgi:hypothetical protein
MAHNPTGNLPTGSWQGFFWGRASERFTCGGLLRVASLAGWEIEVGMRENRSGCWSNSFRDEWSPSMKEQAKMRR